MRHVFSDLMPYVCIFPDCVTPDGLYGRKHQWVELLKSHHQPEYSFPPNADTGCLLCQKRLTPGSIFDRHIARHLENLSIFALPRNLFEDWNDPTLGNEEEGSSIASLNEDDVEAEIVGGPYTRDLLNAHGVS
jgi:hypothetical protein